MDLLSKNIIENLLGESKNIALIPGGFKPPTMGHFYLVQEIAKKQEIDEVVILIGPKIRDGITPENSLDIWNIYLKHIPKTTAQISISESPIKDIHHILGENPQNFYYLVVGIRDDSDLGDLNRFKSIEKKYSNYKQIIYKGGDTTKDTRASNLRKTIINKDFKNFVKHIPISELTEEEVKKIWNILVNTNLNENTPLISKGDIERLDKKLDPEFNPDDVVFTKHFLKRARSSRNNPEISPRELKIFFNKLINYKDKFEDILNKYKSIITTDKKSEINIPFVKKANQIIATTIMRHPEFRGSNVRLIFESIQEAIKGYRAGYLKTDRPAETLADKGIGLVHSRVGLLGTGFYFVGNKSTAENLKKELNYRTITEIDLKAYNLYRPKDAEDFYEGIKNVTSELHQLTKPDLKNPETLESIEVIIKSISEYFDLDYNKTKFIINQYIKDIVSHKDGELLSNRILKAKGYDGIDLTETQYDHFGVGSLIFVGKVKEGTYKPIDKFLKEWALPKISKEKEIKFWGVHYYEMFPKLEKAYKEGNIDKIYQELKNKFKNSETLEALDYFYDVIYNERIPLAEALRKILGKKLLLTENKKSYKKMSLEEALNSVTEFMLQNGIDLKEKPNYKFIEDEENSKNILGSTAFYNPNDNTVNLYTTNRHPKDIIRSYCHEIIHLWQDEQGRIPNIQTTNINEDGNLLKLEEEAYLMGNILMRKWEDQIKK